MSWIRICDGLVDDPKAQLLSLREFKTQFMAAARGESNYFSRFVKNDTGRVFSREWRTIRSRIFARDDYTCHYCKTRGGRLECDHVVPVSKGGATVDSNLVTACFACNRSKRNKSVEEWRRAKH